MEWVQAVGIVLGLIFGTVVAVAAGIVLPALLSGAVRLVVGMTSFVVGLLLLFVSVIHDEVITHTHPDPASGIPIVALLGVGIWFCLHAVLEAEA